jgi:tetratricopeptide (TPR) repeat protein
MNIDTYISEIREILDKEYEEYRPQLEMYLKLLLSERRINPINIRLSSLIAIVSLELRRSTKTTLKYLEGVYHNYHAIISKCDFTMLTTNLAFIYMHECANKEHAAVDLLKQSIDAGSTFAETYFGLALIYFKNLNYIEALPIFKKACEYSDQFRYRYNYAVNLYQCGFICKAIEYLKDLSKDWKCNSNSAHAYFLLCNIYAIQNDMEAVKKIVSDFLSMGHSFDDIEDIDFANLLFFICEYEKSAFLYENSNYVESAEWLGQYFYCLMVMQQMQKAKEKLDEVINNIKEDISEKQNDPLEWKKTELKNYVNFKYKKLSEILKCYDDVFIHSQKPEFHFKPVLIEGCYYIDCPRHSISV